MADISEKLKGIVISRGFDGGLEISNHMDEGSIHINLSYGILQKYKEEILKVL